MLSNRPHLVDDDVEGLLGSFGDVVAATVQHLDRGGERGDRRSQFVADVGREAGLAFDAGLHGVGHVVERSGEPVEVGIGLGGESGVEPARGDVRRRVGDLAEWAQQSSAGRQSEQRGEHDRAEGARATGR